MVSENVRIAPEKSLTTALAGLVGAENIWLSSKTH
jgi:hypothetical protein